MLLHRCQNCQFGFAWLNDVNKMNTKFAPCCMQHAQKHHICVGAHCIHRAWGNESSHNTTHNTTTIFPSNLCSRHASHLNISIYRYTSRSTKQLQEFAQFNSCSHIDNDSCSKIVLNLFFFETIRELWNFENKQLYDLEHVLIALFSWIIK